MIKEIFLFVKWQWHKWQTWQKGYIVCAFFAGAGVFAPKPYDVYLFAVPMLMLFLWTAKWWMIDPMMESWKAYKNEKQNLFNTIKGDQ